MAKPRPLTDEAFNALRSYTPALVGATNAMPTEFPAGFEAAGVRPRDQSRNTFIGLTVSRPEENTVAFGLAYHDRKDSTTDEDMYALDLERRELTFHGCGSWEKIDPRYRDTHHGDKSYLEELADAWEQGHPTPESRRQASGQHP